MNSFHITLKNGKVGYVGARTFEQAERSARCEWGDQVEAIREATLKELQALMRAHSEEQETED